MFGFVLTTHHNNYLTIKKCLDLLFDNIPLANSFVILYVNETSCSKVLNIKKEYNNDIFDVVYIDDQEKNNGLTGTWNQGINYLLDKNKFNCKVITILGHDTFVNKDIKYLLDAGLNAENNKILEYYGPLCKSNKYTGINLWQDITHYKKHHLYYLTGFILTIPVNSLIKNKLNNDKYFNDIRYPFAGNEVEWHQRFTKIGGKPILCTDCIVNHDHNRSWIDIEYKMRKEKINNNDNVFNTLFISNKIQDLNFNWKIYISKNIDLQKKGIATEKQAIDHYMRIGRYQNRIIN
jgi:hypothetical protein